MLLKINDRPLKSKTKSVTEVGITVMHRHMSIHECDTFSLHLLGNQPQVHEIPHFKAICALKGSRFSYVFFPCRYSFGKSGRFGRKSKKKVERESGEDKQKETAATAESEEVNDEDN